MNKHRGFSIVELMIGLAIGAIVLGSTGALYVSTLRASLEGVKQQRFDQSVLTLMNLIATEIRRAGFSNSVTSLPDVPGWTAGSHFYTNGTCALFTYVDTTLPISKQQFFGYKLDTISGVMYFYRSDEKVDCSESTAWEAMTDPAQIKLSQPVGGSLFSNPSNPKLIEIHLIAEATGLKTGSDSVSREVTMKVFIRNN